MEKPAIAEAVQLFARARAQMTTIAGLPESCRPKTPDEGYAIQAEFIEAWESSLVGWKVGGTNEAALKLFAADEPFVGPIFSDTAHLSPVNIDARAFHHTCLECEFCFRMGRDLAPMGRAYDKASVSSAVDAVIPAMELVSPRFAAIPKGDVASAIADCSVGGGIVLGEPVSAWQDLDLANQNVRFLVDDRQMAEGSGALVLGDPINALVFTANTLARLGRHLKAGDLVTTGTCTGVHFVEIGQDCTADFGELGRVDVTYV